MITIKEGENLNYQNFWPEAKEQWPLAVESFCKWIDEYKQSVNWRMLFQEHIKFHHIPLEMQLGVLIEFGISIIGGGRSTNKVRADAFLVTDVLEKVDKYLNDKNEKDTNNQTKNL